MQMIKKILKNQKGISLVSLAIAVVVILTLTNVIILNVKDNLGVQKIQALRSDISNLKDKISNYYAINDTIPIINIEYTNINKIEESGVISEASDTGKFYIIDLGKIENLTLNYGRDYSKITTDSTETEINSYTDLYIINASSHNIFYVEGIKVNDKRYHTDYQAGNIDVEPVELKYVDNVKIPQGFYYVEGRKDTGIIISDVKGDDIQNSKEGNQYVWVPVEDFDEFIRQDFGKQNIAPADFIDTSATDLKYYEAKADGTSDQTEVEKMYKSVKTNKGFFIARFEAGYENGIAVSKKGIQTSNDVNWTTANQRATNAYPTSEEGEVVSTLCYGVQWDAIMRWISKDDNEAEYLKNSNQIGNYTDNGMPALTGSNENYQVKNIYDLAGNVEEWTKELYGTSQYVVRGGNYSSIDANYKTIASRLGVTSTTTASTRGFRTALYIAIGDGS